MTSHLAWPPERFYWAVLDAPQWRRSGPLPPGLAATLEADLPVPLESVHAVATPLGDGRLLACAIDRGHLAALDSDVLSLYPEAAPAFVECATRPGERLNLLVGLFEPRPVTRSRARRHALAAGAVLLLAALVSLGLLRRAAAWEHTAGRAQAALHTMLPDGGHPEALALEVVRLTRLRELSAQIQPPLDAAAALATLLHAWPIAVPSSPQALAVNQSGITVSVAIDGDPSAFLSAFHAPPGWTLEEPRLNRAEALTRVALHFKPRPASGSPTP